MSRKGLIITVSSMVLVIAIILFLGCQQGQPTAPHSQEKTALRQAVEICGDETVEVNGGEYIVMNNIWGEGAGEQCITVDGTSFEVTYSTHTNGSEVKAYPVIYKGYHWGHGTVNPNLPIQVSKIESASISVSISGTSAGGTWNAAFESWYSATGAGDPAGGCELMIWLYRAGGAGPGGSQVGTVNISGNTWDVYYADWDWNYVAYICTSNITSANLDIKAFTDDAVSRGYISSSWYLDALEFGFEIWSDGQGLKCDSYSASATGEVLEVIPPEPPPPSETPTTGTWYKILAGHSGKAMEVANSSTADGGNVQQWDYTDGQNQQWMLEETETSGYYRLTPRHAPSMCLQVQDWSTEDGGNVNQGTYADYQNNQQWSLEKEGDWYQIINRNSGKLVDVQACSETNGANIHQWSYYSDGAESQRWSFQSVDGATTTTTTTAATTSTTTTAATTTTTAAGDCDCGTCSWYGHNVPACCTQTTGWGWQDGGCNRTCVGCQTCIDAGQTCTNCSQCGGATTTTTTAATTTTTSATTTTTAATTTTTSATTTTTSGGGETCSSVDAEISASFTQNGAGEYCWTATSCNYINSWNLEELTVNGEDFTNTWASSSNLPAKIDGKWYIHYVGNYGWSHFELR